VSRLGPCWLIVIAPFGTERLTVYGRQGLLSTCLLQLTYHKNAPSTAAGDRRLALHMPVFSQGDETKGSQSSEVAAARDPRAD
jgi:hypothetical protein